MVSLSTPISLAMDLADLSGFALTASAARWLFDTTAAPQLPPASTQQTEQLYSGTALPGRNHIIACSLWVFRECE
jgi:hypothetical protein